MPLDQTTDNYHTILYALYKQEVLPEFTKSARVLDPEGSTDLVDSAFADTRNRRFPVHTPEHTLISAGYFFKQSCHKSEPRDVLERLTKAAIAHEVEPEFLQIARKLADASQVPLEKSASAYSLLVNQDGHVYGKFQSSTPQLVKQAEEHFVKNYHRYPMSWRTEASANLVKQAQETGAGELHPVIRAYAGENVCFSKKASEHIAKRGFFVDDFETKSLYLRLAQAIQGEMDEPETLQKVARTLDLLDRTNDLDRYYGTEFPDAYKTVFNMTVKAAEAAIRIVDILGNQYTLDELMDVGVGLYRKALGPEFVDAVTESGELKEERLRQVIPTLPRDEKAILARHLQQAIERSDEDAELLRTVSS